MKALFLTIAGAVLAILFSFSFAAPIAAADPGKTKIDCAYLASYATSKADWAMYAQHCNGTSTPPEVGYSCPPKDQEPTYGTKAYWDAWAHHCIFKHPKPPQNPPPPHNPPPPPDEPCNPPPPPHEEPCNPPPCDTPPCDTPPVVDHEHDHHDYHGKGKEGSKDHDKKHDKRYHQGQSDDNSGDNQGDANWGDN